MNRLESKAHKAAFLRLPPRSYDGTVTMDRRWSEKLGEPIQAAVQRWVASGIYRKCGLTETLSLTLTAAALKSMCKERQLKVGGNKAKLIERLTSADPDALQAHADAHPVWLLSDEALRLRQTISAEFAHEDAMARQSIEAAIRGGDLAAASVAWQRYDEARVFSVLEGAMAGSDRVAWIKSCREDIARYLSHGLTETAVSLSVARFFGEAPQTNEGHAMMKAMAYARDLESYRKTDFIVGLRIQAGSTRCEACADIEGCWRLEAPPELPHLGCMKEICLLWWTAIFDHDAMPQWRG